MVEYLKIPKEQGDCVVLITLHPGPNLLGRYLPASKINDLILADLLQAQPIHPQDDVYMQSLDDSEIGDIVTVTGDYDRVGIMDLASFLE
jgi:hypothetical protein